MNRKTFLTLIVLLLTLSFVSGCSNYSDVPDDAWYSEAFQELAVQKNIIDGFKNGTFRSDEQLTYFQFIKSLVLALDADFKPSKSKDAWYLPYAQRAVEIGLVEQADLPTDDRPLTRGETAVFSAKALQHLGQAKQTEQKFDVVFLSDYNAMSINVAHAVSDCYEAGVLNGYQDGSFKPNSTLSRAEGLVVLHRIIDSEQRLDVLNSLESQTFIAPIVKSFHRSGQTFIVFEEVLKLNWAQQPNYRDLFEAHQKVAETYKISYHLYRDDKPISSVEQLTPIRTIDAFSGWNTEIQGINTKDKEDNALTYVCDPADGPLKPYQGLAVVSADQARDAYYAVTVTVNDTTYNEIRPNINTTALISEKPAVAEPVLQSEMLDIHFYDIEHTDIAFYTRWEPEQNSAIADRPFDYLIAKPQTQSPNAALGLHLHGWDGSLTSGYGPWTRQGEQCIFVASNQYPYDWWTGYQEKHYQFGNGFFDRKPEEYADTVVRPYSTKRLLSFVDWMHQSGQWQFDIDKLYVSGYSMGGSGSGMMAIRYPDKIAWCKSEVGVHNPNNSPEYTQSYERVYGPSNFNPLFEDGTPVWQYYNDIWYLQNNREKGTGLIVYSNGKNDEHIGWQQAVNFTKALQETKQPHVFWWGQEGHWQFAKLPINLSRETMLLDLKVKQSLPAFTNCSLDDDFGNGDPAVGAAAGQVNGYLTWNPNTIVDEAARWQIEINLIAEAPQDSCTVDITARKLQKFNLISGQELLYSVVQQSNQSVIDNGRVVVDEYGLFTLNNVKIGKDPCIIRVEKVD